MARGWAAVVLCLFLALGGCASHPSKEETPPDVEKRGGYSQGGYGGESGYGRRSVPLGESALTDPQSPLSKRSIYFAYNSDQIDSAHQATVEAHAHYLAEHPDMRVVLQGNTDERGTPEYNLALGMRRAAAVKEAMVLLGAPRGQIETVSFGEEKPKAHGSGEEAWSENRRVDIVYEHEVACAPACLPGWSSY